MEQEIEKIIESKILERESEKRTLESDAKAWADKYKLEIPKLPPTNYTLILH